MQKKNTVIKNYILSTKKRILKENTLSKKHLYISFIDNYLYHLPLKQNKDFSYLFLLRK